jgi:Fic family protein
VKIPNHPPDWRAIFASTSRIPDLFDAAREEAARPDRYLHWDEFRRRGNVEGFTAEERWAGLKLVRRSRAHPIPLNDGQGRPFTFFVTQRMFQLLHDIDQRCAGAISMPGEVVNSDTRDRYYISSLMEEALTSSQLEGAVLTRAEAKDLLRAGRQPGSKHERMVVNNFLTMQHLQELKDQDLTPELIREIHRRISAGTLDHHEDEGRLRTDADEVRIEDEESGEVMHLPPPAAQLPARLEALCAFANDRAMTGFLHPVVRSILLHFWLAYDHPFVDGNGRTARALFYWSMIRHGFWLFEFISISHVILRAPKQYYGAFLHTETDENDLNYFLLHQLETISRAIDVLHDYIARKKREQEDLRAILQPGNGLNHRQLALLRHALQHPDASYTVESHRSSHRVVTQTARTDLNDLVRRELLDTSKIGKAIHYSPARDLAARVRQTAKITELATLFRKK